jgi:monofunctional biosynthetic peptidoglycan transglycosylase
VLRRRAGGGRRAQRGSGRAWRESAALSVSTRIRTPERPLRRRRRGLLRRLLGWTALAALGWLLLCTLGLVYLRFFPPVITALQVQRLIEYGELPAFGGSLPLRSFGPHLPRAVVAAEDARFYEHHGIDWIGVREAAEDNWQRGRVWRGGSTITQQLVKNLFLTTYGSVLRKLFEIPLALLADLILGKQRSLELYLNEVEWGPGVYGGAAAAETYYGVAPAFLNREQAARLAACLPAPRTRRPQRMNVYSRKILRRMASVGW